MLIVEDDPSFASVLLDIAHDAGIKGVVSSAGSGTAIDGPRLRPSAITLDLGLSDIDGFVLLDLLRHDPESSDIPVYVIGGRAGGPRAHARAERIIEKPAERSEELIELFTSVAEKFAQQGPRKPRARPRAASRASGHRLRRLNWPASAC